MTTKSSLLRLSIGSDLEEVDLVGVAIQSTLEQIGVEADQSHWLVMSVREAVINAIIHGNQQDPTKRVRVEVDLDGPDYVVRVADEGEGFDPDSLPDPTAPENLLRPSGRGVFLMRQFADLIEYSFPANRGTVVTMRKQIATPPEEEQE
jgi:serine/threonine-protein kinase RsbW